jgi:uncharacterized protein (DUF2249 family)
MKVLIPVKDGSRRRVHSEGAMSRKRVVTLDVRDDIRNGREPFSRIMQAVAGLRDADDLLLIAPFEPAPLYALLAQQGLGHETRRIDGDDYEIRFSRAILNTSPEKKDAAARTGTKAAGNNVVELDARGLEPPEPLVKILEAVAELRPGAELHARPIAAPCTCTAGSKNAASPLALNLRQTGPLSRMLEGAKVPVSPAPCPARAPLMLRA